jgi:hypothetical protein
MTRRFIFADEAGDFTFAKGNNISRYFIVCTVTMDSCDAAHDLLELRREMAWQKITIGDFFHATTDAQKIRDAVFESIKKRDFRVQATIMEKAKAQPHIRATKHRFYQFGWLYHFRHSLAKYVADDDEILITAASIGTKKGQAVFTNAVNDVVQQHLPRDQWATCFCPASHDPCLQVADYCTWAIQRKWERNDSRSYDLIKDRITYEYDLWRRGTTYHY